MTQKAPDQLKYLGELAFASRLKRLSEQLMKDVSRIYTELDYGFEARWFAALKTLDKTPGRSVTELAEDLGLTHAAINQIAKEMSDAGLLLSSKDKKDERRRRLKLSRKGKNLSKKLKPVWDEVAMATMELIKDTGGDWLDNLDKIEQALDKRGMYERLRARVLNDKPAIVTIEDYRPAYKKNFSALNYEWIDKYFKIEAQDKKTLSDPNRQVIRRGGAILFAKSEGRIVGTCALIKHGPQLYELAKMAVSPAVHGRGIGWILGNAIIEKAILLKARKLFLLTHEALKPAISLYHKLGFVFVEDKYGGCGDYERCTITMELNLDQRYKSAKLPGKRKKVSCIKPRR